MAAAVAPAKPRRNPNSSVGGGGAATDGGTATACGHSKETAKAYSDPAIMINASVAAWARSV